MAGLIGRRLLRDGAQVTGHAGARIVLLLAGHPHLGHGFGEGVHGNLRLVLGDLREPDVDFMRGVVRPAVQYPAEPLKTECSKTPVPAGQSLALQLSAHLAQWPGETVLTGMDGGQLSTWALERAIRTARARVRTCKKCKEVQPRAGRAFRCRACGATDSEPGLPVGFRYHDLRHYFASLLIAKGADVKTVQARLRHGSAKTTLDTYGHLWPDKDESTKAIVDEAVDERFGSPADSLRTAGGAP